MAKVAVAVEIIIFNNADCGMTLCMRVFALKNKAQVGVLHFQKVCHFSIVCSSLGLWWETCRIQTETCHLSLQWKRGSFRGLKKHTRLTAMAPSSFPGRKITRMQHSTWWETSRYPVHFRLFLLGTCYRCSRMFTSFCCRGPRSSTTTRTATSQHAVCYGCNPTTQHSPGVFMPLISSLLCE